MEEGVQKEKVPMAHKSHDVTLAEITTFNILLYIFPGLLYPVNITHIFIHIHMSISFKKKKLLSI